MNMRDLLTLERVIPSLRAGSKRSALHKLAAHIAGDAAVAAASIRRAVMECAEMPAFGPGAGVSLPHAFVRGLGNPIAAFARLEPAVDFSAADGSKTDLLALLLSPTESAGDHLRALACMARALREPRVRALLRAANSRDALYVILCGSEEQRSPVSAEFAGPPQRKHR
jgi:PTS system nitrogen regulatory IIA component